MTTDKDWISIWKARLQITLKEGIKTKWKQTFSRRAGALIEDEDDEDDEDEVEEEESDNEDDDSWLNGSKMSVNKSAVNSTSPDFEAFTSTSLKRNLVNWLIQERMSDGPKNNRSIKLAK